MRLPTRIRPRRPLRLRGRTPPRPRTPTRPRPHRSPNPRHPPLPRRQIRRIRSGRTGHQRRGIPPIPQNHLQSGLAPGVFVGDGGVFRQLHGGDAVDDSGVCAGDANGSGRERRRVRRSGGVGRGGELSGVGGHVRCRVGGGVQRRDRDVFVPLSGGNGGRWISIDTQVETRWERRIYWEHGAEGVQRWDRVQRYESAGDRNFGTESQGVSSGESEWVEGSHANRRGCRFA
mmetsp:Transcript_17643/g.37063  ORF Transcript_17643/g.37063 Transcript_17643/m.37063 type:complete len:231 (+) Transcript_17643:1203-1895(+)